MQKSKRQSRSQSFRARVLISNRETSLPIAHILFLDFFSVSTYAVAITYPYNKLQQVTCFRTVVGELRAVMMIDYGGVFYLLHNKSC